MYKLQFCTFISILWLSNQLYNVSKSHSQPPPIHPDVDQKFSAAAVFGAPIAYFGDGGTANNLAAAH